MISSLRTDRRSPNFTDFDIPVEFVVIHYTAGDLDRAFHHFLSPNSEGVSCHLLIDVDGTVFELVECLGGVVKRAWHAGGSRLVLDGALYSGFNDFSIGIEIVNRNGNLIPYTDSQYKSLDECLKHLIGLYPALKNPDRILGHEQISAWRGKADPGILFDWNRVFSGIHPNLPHPDHKASCPADLADSLAKFLKVIPSNREDAVNFWHAVSATTESSIKLLYERTTRLSSV